MLHALVSKLCSVLSRVTKVAKETKIFRCFESTVLMRALYNNSHSFLTSVFRKYLLKYSLSILQYYFLAIYFFKMFLLMLYVCLELSNGCFSMSSWSFILQGFVCLFVFIELFFFHKAMHCLLLITPLNRSNCARFLMVTVKNSEI